MKLRIVLTFGLLIFALMGCDNTIDPLNQNRGKYSIYGHLDMNDSLNYVRVKNLNRPLSISGSKPLDLKVSLTNQTKGITNVLQDTVVSFDSVKTHNYRAAMNIEAGNQYLLSILGPDKEKYSTGATAPRRSKTDVAPTNENCLTSINVSFQPIKKKLDLDIEIGFVYDGQRYWVPFNQISSNPNETMSVSFEPIDILGAVFDTPQQQQTVWCWELDSKQFYVRYVHYGPDYFEDKTNSSDLIGEFGVFYQEQFSFPIDTVRICPPDCPPIGSPY